jgi:type II secretory pathway component PulM
MTLAQIAEIASALRARLEGLEERDRRALKWGGVIVAAFVVIAIPALLAERISASEQRIARKQALLAELPYALDRLRRTNRLGVEAALPLGSLARRLVDQTGVGGAVEVTADGGVTILATGVPFDAALELLADLAANDIVTRRARLSATGAAGRVDLQLELSPRAP